MATIIQHPSDYTGSLLLGPIVVDFADGKASTETPLTMADRERLEGLGFRFSGDAPAAPMAAYDPSAYDVTEVKAYLEAASESERQRVQELEAAGKARKTIVEWEPTPLPTSATGTPNA